MRFPVLILAGTATVSTVLLLLLFPYAHAFLVGANFIIHVVILLLQLGTTWLPRRDPDRLEQGAPEPFVTIHVPAHNEPPEVLIETLRALSRLRWSQYEVLVIDNNTKDETIWRPVEQFCRQLGPKFRFLHVEGLSGAKAGALNWARPLSDARAEFLFVVDADYVVERNALRKAIRYFTDPLIGLVQFPQDYRNIGPGNTGLALDFKHFFSGYMNMANRLGCVPSTGTLTMIRLEALESIGGFDTRIITEDADLGLRLNRSGFRTLYANEVIGQGLMPHDLESLKKQRWRWAFGNAQILKLNWRHLLLGRDLSPRQKLGYLVHLTAWFNFNLIPSLTLIVLAPLAWLGRMHPVHPYLVVLSGFTLTTFMVLRFGTLYYGLRRDGHSLREILEAFFTHLGLGWILSASWMKCLIDHRSPFVRTDKFLHATLPGPLRATLAEIALGVGLLLASLTLAASDYLIGPIAALLFGLGRFLIFWVWWQTRFTLNLTRTLGRVSLRPLSGAAANVQSQGMDLRSAI